MPELRVVRKDLLLQMLRRRERSPAAFGRLHGAAPPVPRILRAFDEAVTLHPVERLRHGLWLDMCGRRECFCARGPAANQVIEHDHRRVRQIDREQPIVPPPLDSTRRSGEQSSQRPRRGIEIGGGFGHEPILKFLPHHCSRRLAPPISSPVPALAFWPRARRRGPLASAPLARVDRGARTSLRTFGATLTESTRVGQRIWRGPSPIVTE